MPRIVFQPSGLRGELQEGESILKAAARLGEAIASPCSGRGICGRCKVIIEGQASPPAAGEFLLLGKNPAPGERLACTTIPEGDISVLIPPDNTTFKQIATKSGISRDVEVDIRPGFEDAYGAAFDIGSTTVAGMLVSFGKGEVVASVSHANPQTQFGEDIMSRVDFAGRPGGYEKLRGALVGLVNAMLDELCRDAGIENRQVRELFAVGNTVMHHFLFNLPVDRLGGFPFEPATTAALDVPAPLL
ncbi:MAG TPA: 2Fe-2S iron-sulfur cluster-binding protein, partial [Nitrospirota bacterium]